MATEVVITIQRTVTVILETMITVMETGYQRRCNE